MPSALVVTARLNNGAPAEARSSDGRYTWWHGESDWLKDTQANRPIFQMRYPWAHGFGGDPVPDDVRRDVTAFWEALAQEQVRCQHLIAAAERERFEAECATAGQRRYRPDVTGAERARKEREYDLAMNEGGEGYNPWRD
ncbi:hypothetical protein E4T66_18510 [Sinimarinibacterium sp. CAU 1509]|uniref:hypothetical protein n=1 Tax=Sinimarinibacterium sp. CAU 1509 TaxID=2562283 RepID=UPI0010AD3659|nr:hypothetical protein [Sinimarinibacterium sp. CAU 1509]TJY57400.1 hypothetical protein E4T66_18510 [Sinimarinibacterium sp. CAU 1509]